MAVHTAHLIRKSGRRCDALADQLGFRAAADVASAVQVVRTRVKQLLREGIAESLDPGADIEDEMAHVRAVLNM